MKTRTIVATAVVLLAMAAANGSFAAQSKINSKHHQIEIAHGEYLVKAIGQCGDCHSPMNEKGEFIPGQWLQGKKLDFAPTVADAGLGRQFAQHRRTAGLEAREGGPVLHDRAGAQWTAGTPAHAGVQDESRRRRGRGGVFGVVEIVLALEVPSGDEAPLIPGFGMSGN